MSTTFTAKIRRNLLLTVSSVVVGYHGRQLAALGSSNIWAVGKECMVGMAHVGLRRSWWGLLTRCLLPGGALLPTCHQQLLACSRREASLSAVLMLPEAMMLPPAAAAQQTNISN